MDNKNASTTPTAKALPSSSGSEYPLPWEVCSSRARNATVYAANSEPICFMSGKDAAIKANLIVELANKNK